MPSHVSWNWTSRSPHGRRWNAHDVVAHERLVDAPDLLDVERAVREALPLEDEELLEDLEHGAVVDRREPHGRAILGLRDRRATCRSPAL